MTEETRQQEEAAVAVHRLTAASVQPTGDGQGRR